MALLMIQGYVSPIIGRKVRDSQFLVDWLPQIVRDIGMQAVGDPVVEQYSHWSGNSPSVTQFIEAPSSIPTHTTGVQIVTTSAVTIHTYPDDFVQILIDSCLEIPAHYRVRNKIMASLNMTPDYTYYDVRWGWKGAKA